MTSTDELTIDPNVLSKKLNNEEINTETNMDTTVLSGPYMRCIYIMLRLKQSFNFLPAQVAGIVGNLCFETDGRLGTSIKKNNKVGICQWNYQKQVDYKKFVLSGEELVDANLNNQVSFLIHEIINLGLVDKISKRKNVNDVCKFFYANFLHKNEKIDFSNSEIKEEISKRRAFSNTVFKILARCLYLFKKEWNVGFYKGEGSDDGHNITPTDDTKTWVSCRNYDIINAGAIDYEFDESEFERLMSFRLETCNLTEEEMETQIKNTLENSRT